MRSCNSLLVILWLTACRTGLDYPDVGGPRYAGGPAPVVADRSGSDTLHIVTYNIEFALRVDSAIVVLRDSALRGADVVLLQEMDDAGTRRIAETLGMAYRYYPASFHLKYRRDVGNAVLSRWPIVEDSKILLPHPSRFVGTHRTATAATIRIGESLVRVYSTHLGTVANVGPQERRNQLRAILADAEKYPKAIIGGDLNNPWVGRVARERGYAWPTENGPRTAIVGRIDHIFVKGLATPERAAAGTVTNGPRASDHRPVWARAILQ